MALLKEKEHREKLLVFLFFLFVSIGIFLFFYRVHPVVPYVYDDFAVLTGFGRITGLPFVPSNPSAITPTRITPDILGILSGYLGAFVLKPIVGNYLLAIVCSTAVFLTAFITLLFAGLYRVFILAFHGNRHRCVLGLTFFLAFSFMFMKSEASGNYYLFEPVCTCGVFYYLLTPLSSFFLIFYDISRRHTRPYPSLLPQVKEIAIGLPVIYMVTMTVIHPNIPLFAYAAWIMFFDLIANLKLRSKQKHAKDCWIGTSQN